MKEIHDRIVSLISDVDFMDRDTIIGILNPLKTESQAKEMLLFIEANKDDLSIMRIDVLLKKALQIGN